MICERDLCCDWIEIESVLLIWLWLDVVNNYTELVTFQLTFRSLL